MDILTFKKSNCRNCHKCIRYCPVKSIRFSGNQAYVIPDECVLCGECYVVCPQNAKEIVDETEAATVLLRSGAPVYASLAPSFAAYYDGRGIGALRRALMKLGFAAVEETALGATIVKREYERISRDGLEDVVITSCCHTVNLLIEKYYPEILHCLAPVVTPMRAHCEKIKREHPEARTIFIGPCLSKKDEAASSSIDAALTFEEIDRMLEKAGITIEDEKDSLEESRARRFPTSGGVLDSMTYRNPYYTYLTVDGMDNVIAALDDIAGGNVHRAFIEMSSCQGSCIRGPIMRKHHKSPVTDFQSVVNYAGEADFDIVQPSRELTADGHQTIILKKPMPSETEIREILRRMNKLAPEDELNCGTCGYNTCREKAIAVYQGKAEITMCLPYLMEKAERFADNILDNTPNGILVVNDSYEVQSLNRAAMRMLRINSRSDVMGEPLIRIMDPKDFIAASQYARPIMNKRDYYAEFDCFLELTVVVDKRSNSIMGIFRDVTEEEKAKKESLALREETAATADRVVDKQMRIVQEIASLLGETAAETKIALTKLKESISNDNE